MLGPSTSNERTRATSRQHQQQQQQQQQQQYQQYHSINNNNNRLHRNTKLNINNTRHQLTINSNNHNNIK
ncbi:hypothetical protein QCA50_009916 [Cerrena zonata]|uniref:Uncharacterized protein n=1 Tax=Cerrena zonata TaxID=2478898 RepID=A0AAW0G0T8_9APHY